MGVGGGPAFPPPGPSEPPPAYGNPPCTPSSLGGGGRDTQDHRGATPGVGVTVPVSPGGALGGGQSIPPRQT